VTSKAFTLTANAFTVTSKAFTPTGIGFDSAPVVSVSTCFGGCPAAAIHLHHL
jgi:hypothetical protein